MTVIYYILDINFNPIPCEDLVIWAQWFENSDRHLSLNYVIDSDSREIKISTVFLGLDHGYPQWSGHPENYKPLLWETMIFGGDHDGYQERYSSKKSALEGHKKAMEMIEGNK